MTETVDRYLEPLNLAELASRLAAAGELVGISDPLHWSSESSESSESPESPRSTELLEPPKPSESFESPESPEYQALSESREFSVQSLTDWPNEQARALLQQIIPCHLCYDSRDTVLGSLFFCKGAHFQTDYLIEAQKRGALAYISESIQPLALPGLIIRDARRAMALTAAWYYAKLLKQLTIIGVTGTKGKSTTVYFIKSILDCWMQSLGEPETAILSSIDNYDGVIFEESHLTTQESLDLYRHFANAVASGISYLSMEVSSQGLKYHRVTGIPFTVGCFLNFGRDHISEIEHSDIEDYLSSKLKIFEQTEVACINLGSDQIERVVAAAKTAEWLITFGWTEFAELSASNHVDQGTSGSSFTAQLFGQEVDFQLALAGDFNVENALAAIATTTALGVPIDIIREGLAKALVPGRMEPFQAPDNKLILVDYAHNQMSFDALFKAVRAAYPNSSISIVFGCPGYKAYDRRHDLGLIAGREARDVVLTEEDAGAEPVLEICQDIAQYVRAAGVEPRIILDREEAIISAIDQALPGAVILITGKGRETRQKRGTEYIEVISDVAIVQNYIQTHSDQSDENLQTYLDRPGEHVEAYSDQSDELIQAHLDLPSEYIQTHSDLSDEQR